MLRIFDWYSRGFVARHFHAVRVSRLESPLELPSGPVVVAMSHASWWDPLVGLLLRHRLGRRAHVAPIDARALERYRFLGRLGLFGVEQGTSEGYRQLLSAADHAAARQDAALWITPQGRFVDPRSRPLRLRPGIGHVIQRIRRGAILPLAIEYPFWDERLPEALARFGPPMLVGDGGERTAEAWTAEVTALLERTQDALAADAVTRSPDRFETVLTGRSGVSPVYDVWRRFRAALRGERFDPAHGAIGRPALPVPQEARR